MGLVNTGIKSTHVYNEIYCCIFDVVDLFFCQRSWTSCLDTWHHGFYQIPTDKKNQYVTDSVSNLIMGHVWIFNRTIIQTQTLKTTQKWVTEHKTKLLLWPFQSSDLNPRENEWGELKRRSCESEGSGVILDEGMVSDLLSGVL